MDCCEREEKRTWTVVRERKTDVDCCERGKRTWTVVRERKNGRGLL